MIVSGVVAFFLITYRSVCVVEICPCFESWGGAGQASLYEAALGQPLNGISGKTCSARTVLTQGDDGCAWKSAPALCLQPVDVSH